MNLELFVCDLRPLIRYCMFVFFLQAEDGIRDGRVTGVQTCALPISWAPFRTAYLGYLMRALPEVARKVASNPDAYVYLAESIRAWPDQPGLAARIGAAGWGKVAWRNLTGGVVALHRAIRP